jgi:hypothetical protein
VSYRLGRRPPRSAARSPRLALSRFLTGQLPTTPPIVDWVSRVGASNWQMYGNDRWGDCVFAAAGHMITATSLYGTGALITPSEAEILRAYSAVTGFDPNAGPPGSNPTDQGTVVQDALSYWRRTGVAGHKILAFAEVDVRDLAEVADALYLFGHLMLGVNLPNAAMQQFDAGQAWHLTPDDGGTAGGHAVNLGYEARGGGYRAITWGRSQPFSADWWAKYVEEAWVVVSPEWLTAAGTDPAGVDLAALSTAFTALTGQPFPSIPTPPAGDPADAVLVAALDTWAHHHHVGENAHAAHAYLTWRTAKGL